jgi:hypothetical protein
MAFLTLNRSEQRRPFPTSARILAQGCAPLADDKAGGITALIEAVLAHAQADGGSVVDILDCEDSLFQSVYRSFLCS